jgi:hypothetical protein
LGEVYAGVLVRKPEEKKYIDLVQDRESWWALVNAAMDLQVP